MAPGLELGRSFVRAEYQKSYAALLLLWKGIGQYVARNPRLLRYIAIAHYLHKRIGFIFEVAAIESRDAA